MFSVSWLVRNDHSIHFRELLDTLSSSPVKIPDMLWLGPPFAFWYETCGKLNRVRTKIRNGGLPDDIVDLIDTITGECGVLERKVRKKVMRVLWGGVVTYDEA